MRQITNWTKEQIEEFRKLKVNIHSPILAMVHITEENDEYPKLYDTYAVNTGSEDILFAQDIIDLMSGKAKFKEEKYVFLLKGFRPIENLRYALTRNDETTRSDFGYYAEDGDETYSWFHFTEHEAKQLIEQAGLHYDDFEKIEVPQDDD